MIKSTTCIKNISGRVNIVAMTESKLPQDAKDYFVYVCFISSTEEVYITVWSMFNLWERGKERSHPKHCMFPTIQNFRVSFIEGFRYMQDFDSVGQYSHSDNC